MPNLSRRSLPLSTARPSSCCLSRASATADPDGWRTRIEEIRGDEHNYVAVDDSRPGDMAGVLFVLGKRADA